MSAISTKPNVPKKHSKLQETWRRFSKNGRAVVGLCIVIMLVLCAVLAPIISPYEPKMRRTRATVCRAQVQTIGSARMSLAGIYSAA